MPEDAYMWESVVPLENHKQAWEWKERNRTVICNKAWRLDQKHDWSSGMESRFLSQDPWESRE